MTPMSEVPNLTNDPSAAELLAETAAEVATRPVPAAGGRRTLWRHADYMKLWTAATISLMGSQVSQIAIPFIAAVVLNATPLEVALLGIVDMLPFILFALPAGAWLDRVRRRPGADRGRFRPRRWRCSASRSPTRRAC